MKKIAILGFGIVGGGIAEVLDQNKDQIEYQLGEKVEIGYILDKLDFKGTKYESIVVKDIQTILDDPEVVLVAETMGGLHPAYEFSLAALQAGKSVVTSNKAVVAKYGSILLQTAKENNVRYLFEASVGGGIPIIRPLCDSLAGNKICSITGILNGTTNFILNEMENKGASFEAALASAQEKGYAEKDPTDDIEGYDAKRKICILAALAFGKMFPEEAVACEGITNLDLCDVNILSEIGAKIKLIGHAKQVDDHIIMYVRPCVCLMDNPLASVSGVYNGIMVEGNVLGKVMFYGKGAGRLPTASAVVSDILNILMSPCKVDSIKFEEGAVKELCQDRSGKHTFYIRMEQEPVGYSYRALSGAYLVDQISRNEIEEKWQPDAYYQVL
ncbi:MAG: homoserine dehydrogenase [Clostridiales bacterium]|nr:homoserine dehydrogenase [Clostridiales bacterium]